jgi:CheY-like chemotaxis protein/HD-like signal output (HDOD) protein
MNATIPAPVRAAPNAAAAVVDAQPPPSVLVIDDSSLCRELVCAALRSQGFGVTSAGDGCAGLESLEVKSPDVVLLDNEMPRMTGLEFLKSLRTDKRWKHLPVVMLTTSTSKRVIVEALSLGISGYLHKERFSMPEMLSRVQNAAARGRLNIAGGPAPVSTATPAVNPVAEKPAAASTPKPTPNPVKPAPVSVPNLLSREATLAGIADLGSARSLAGVTTRVLEIAASPKANAAEMSAILRQDPLLAAKVIQLAGSSAYAGSKARVAGIEDAVRVVGVTAIGEMAATVAVFKAFPQDRADGIDLLRCWQHAFGVATVMSRIVPKSDLVPPGLPYLLGLCHDLGEILLRQKFPTEYAAAKDYALQGGEPVNDLLPKVFGISYSELVQAILEHLKFPQAVAAPIKQYAPYAGWPVEAHVGLLPRALTIADFMAHGMLLTSSAENLISPVLQNDCRTSLISGGAINVAEICAETLATVSALAKVDPEEEATLSNPMIGLRETMVCYVRPPQFASLDPVAAALGNLGNVKIYDRLMKPEGLGEAQGLVVVAPEAENSLMLDVIRLRNSCRPEMPVLSLISADAQPTPGERPGIQEISYPLPVSRLARFIFSLKAKA